MAVPCRSCGREYDVTLFEFGRTICCTCGSRVGIEPRVRRQQPHAERRFAADAMLGRLARWLRLLGFDCAYDPGIPDEEIVRTALAERRTILTRDRRLPAQWWIDDVLVLRAEDLREQLAEVIRHFDLAAAIRVLTRCSRCNLALRPVSRAHVAERVPERVHERCDGFSECPGCRRVYWEGSHVARIRARVEHLLADA